MSTTVKRILACFFFLSGFCGLLYQIIWVRLAFASFGIIIPVMSVVISVFMLGLALGSWAGGKLIAIFKQNTKLSAIAFYAMAELAIGIGGLTIPHLFPLGENLLLPLGEMESTQYMFFSGIVITLVILPWCIAMGATFPFMMAFVKELDSSVETSFSFLYLANVIGAMFGAILTAFVLVELFGFSNTLIFAAIINFMIALGGLKLNKKYPLQQKTPSPEIDLEIITTPRVPPNSIKLTHIILFTTGFTALAMEVTWIRAFAPILGNKIYSFSLLLTTYLLATLAGSSYYRKHLKNGPTINIANLLGACFVFSYLPVVLNDPRLSNSPIVILASIFPFCAALGYLTPKLIDEFSKGRPEGAGKVYAVNIIGSIFGPLFAGYFLIPAVGVRYSLILLAAPFCVFYLLQIKNKKLNPVPKWGLGLSGLALTVSSIFFTVSYENPQFYNENSLILRDHTATVIASGKGMDKRLRINGIHMTSLTPITKVMGHLPMSIREKKPESALFIAMGMGTTLRSLETWGISVTGVELIPSVKKAFPFFFSDADIVLGNPKVNVVIDDGRRFLKRTQQKFDVITVDPPPPIESAGSGLLYSKEFYQTVIRRLNKDGIFHQWFPQGERKILQAVVRSLAEAFPHVRGYISISGYGIHFLASTSSFNTPTVDEMVARLPDSAQADLIEWSPEVPVRDMVNEILKNEIPLWNLLDRENEDIFISDDKPYNEYFLIRRTLNKMTVRIF